MKKLQRKISMMQRVDQNILEATKTQRNIAKTQGRQIRGECIKTQRKFANPQSAIRNS